MSDRFEDFLARVRALHDLRKAETDKANEALDQVTVGLSRFVRSIEARDRLTDLYAGTLADEVIIQKTRADAATAEVEYWRRRAQQLQEALRIERGQHDWTLHYAAGWGRYVFPELLDLATDLLNERESLLNVRCD
jgi:predicted aminopeptidase